MVLFWAIGFVVFARFAPPPSPSLGAEEVAEIYRTRTDSIKVGLLLTAVGSALLGPFITVVSIQMQRIEGRWAPLAWLQLAMGAIVVLEFIFPTAILQAAAYRSDRSPEAVQALNDVGWMMFVGIVSTAVVEWVAIGACILLDQRDEPIFPRWFGYLNIWVGLSYSVGAFIVFFKSGPMAWNGIIGFWTPIIAFLVWIVCVVPLLFRAVAQQEAEHAPSSKVAPADPSADPAGPVIVHAGQVALDVSNDHER